jgi:hypothetical protein
MQPFHIRLAQLWWLQKKQGALTDQEIRDWVESLTANMNWVWKVNMLKTLSFIAYQLKDTDWQHEICAKLEDLGVNSHEA